MIENTSIAQIKNYYYYITMSNNSHSRTLEKEVDNDSTWA